MRAPLLALLLLVAALPLRAEEPVHVVQPKETLSAISRLYGVPMATLISINSIEDPNKVKIGTALKLPVQAKPIALKSQETKPVVVKPVETKPATPLLLAKKSATPDWRHYGPLQVDWKNWRTMAGSLVAPSINKEGQPGQLEPGKLGKPPRKNLRKNWWVPFAATPPYKRVDPIVEPVAQAKSEAWAAAVTARQLP